MILKSPFEQYEEAAGVLEHELDSVGSVNLAEVCKVIQSTLPDHVVIAFISAYNEYRTGIEMKSDPDWSDNMCWLSAEFLKMLKRMV